MCACVCAHAPVFVRACLPAPHLFPACLLHQPAVRLGGMPPPLHATPQLAAAAAACLAGSSYSAPGDPYPINPSDPNQEAFEGFLWQVGARLRPSARPPTTWRCMAGGHVVPSHPPAWLPACVWRGPLGWPDPAAAALQHGIDIFIEVERISLYYVITAMWVTGVAQAHEKTSRAPCHCSPSGCPRCHGCVLPHRRATLPSLRALLPPRAACPSTSTPA